MINSEADVRKAIEPHQVVFWSIFDTALAEWIAHSNWRSETRLEPILYSRTRANYIFDAIARAGRRMFADTESVVVIEEAQSLKFCFSDVAVVRLKKCGPNGVGQNIPTQAVLDFHNPQKTLPGLPPEAAKVEVVWQADELGMTIEKLIVNSRRGNNVIWAFELDRPVSAAQIVPLPTQVDIDDDGPLIKPIRQNNPSQQKD